MFLAACDGSTVSDTLMFANRSIDTDMVVHDDMYKYLKGPLLSNLTWICGDEVNDPGRQMLQPPQRFLTSDASDLTPLQDCRAEPSLSPCSLQRRHQLHPGAAPDGGAAWMAGQMADWASAPLFWLCMTAKMVIIWTVRHCVSGAPWSSCKRAASISCACLTLARHGLPADAADHRATAGVGKR